MANINFHQTFQPKKNHLVSLLSNASSIIQKTKEEISVLTGIPTGESSGQVVPHLEYARYMNLLNFECENEKYSVSFTDLGNIVFNEDRNLNEKVTLLLLHSMFMRPSFGADVWRYSFHSIFPKYFLGLEKELFMNELKSEFSNANEKNTAPFFSSYQELFSSLNILQETNGKLIVSPIKRISEYDFLFGYVLLEYWDEIFPNENEITIEDFEKLNFGKTFGWDSKKEVELLEILNDRKIISLNKQLSPFSIIKRDSKETVMKKIYSELL